jgi:hypothetical protein
MCFWIFRVGGSIKGGCRRWRFRERGRRQSSHGHVAGINVDIHEVLKLATLSSRFSIVN